MAARAGSGRGTAATDCADMETGGTALAHQAAAFLEGLLAPLGEGEGAEQGDTGGKAAEGQGRVEHAVDSSERGASAVRDGGDGEHGRGAEAQAAAVLATRGGASADAEVVDGASGGVTKEQAQEEHKTDCSERSAPAMRGGSDSSDDEQAERRNEALQDGRQAAGAGTKAEVVQDRAAGSEERRARTDPGAEGNEQGAPTRGNENDNDGKAKAKVSRTATRGRLHRLGRLDSSGGGRATTQGAPGGGAPTGGR